MKKIDRSEADVLKSELRRTAMGEPGQKPIDLNDPVLAARTELMHQVGDDFLAGATLARNEHGHIAGPEQASHRHAGPRPKRVLQDHRAPGRHADHHFVRPGLGRRERAVRQSRRLAQPFAGQGESAERAERVAVRVDVGGDDHTVGGVDRGRGPCDEGVRE